MPRCPAASLTRQGLKQHADLGQALGLRFARQPAQNASQQPQLAFDRSAFRPSQNRLSATRLGSSLPLRRRRNRLPGRVQQADFRHRPVGQHPNVLASFAGRHRSPSGPAAETRHNRPAWPYSRRRRPPRTPEGELPRLQSLAVPDRRGRAATVFLADEIARLMADASASSAARRADSLPPNVALITRCGNAGLITN